MEHDFSEWKQLVMQKQIEQLVKAQKPRTTIADVACRPDTSKRRK